MKPFTAKIQIIGVNPYVRLPKEVLAAIFEKAGRATSPLRVKGTLDGKRFEQTLVKYRGVWRLYLNTPMRRSTDTDVGDVVTVSVEYDPKPRDEETNPALTAALAANRAARDAFEALPPSRRNEIARYLNFAKTETTLERNVGHVMTYLAGKRPQGLHAILRIPRRAVRTAR